MAIYRIIAAVNTAPGHVDGYRPGHRLAGVTSGPGAMASILFALDAPDTAAVLEAMWEIGNRITGDLCGHRWPLDVRPVSVGDVLLVFAPGFPLHIHDLETFAVAPTGFTRIPDPLPSAWIPLEGSSATSRPVRIASVSSIHAPLPPAATPGEAQL